MRYTKLGASDGARMRLDNEFATVDLELMRGGQILRVTDSRTGLYIDLDPLEVEALTRLGPDDLDLLVSPSFLGLSGGVIAADDELVPGEGEEPDFS